MNLVNPAYSSIAGGRQMNTRTPSDQYVYPVGDSPVSAKAHAAWNHSMILVKSPDIFNGNEFFGGEPVLYNHIDYVIWRNTLSKDDKKDVKTLRLFWFGNGDLRVLPDFSGDERKAAEFVSEWLVEELVELALAWKHNPDPTRYFREKPGLNLEGFAGGDSRERIIKYYGNSPYHLDVIKAFANDKPLNLPDEFVIEWQEGDNPKHIIGTQRREFVLSIEEEEKIRDILKTDPEPKFAYRKPNQVDKQTETVNQLTGLVKTLLTAQTGKAAEKGK